jgi:hypothetical protein
MLQRFWHRLGDMGYRLVANVGRWLTAPAGGRPLAALRIGLAAVLLGQAFEIAGSLHALYGEHGILQWVVNPYNDPPGLPRLTWVVAALAPLGVGAAAAVQGVFLVYVASLACLLLGWRTRTAAALAWLTHLMMKVTGSANIYGVDEFAHIGLFYCIWMPVARAWSVDRWGRPDEPTWESGLALRVLQLHVCLVYFSSGVEKATGEQWWNGEAIWRALLRPDFGQYDMTWLAEHAWVAVLAGWGTLAVEIGYAFFVWHRRTRPLMVAATIGLHLGIAVMLGLGSFAAVMIVLNVAAFLVPRRPAAAPAAVPARVAVSVS